MLTWQNRITRIQVRERDLFGRWASRWRVIRTSNAYVFRDPKPGRPARFSCLSPKIRSGTLNQEILDPVPGAHRSTRTALWSAPCGSWAAPSKKDCS